MAQHYDSPGSGMSAPDVLGPTVDRLIELAGGGRVLEFAIGTGRVAVPLAERGVPVSGIELSRPMVEQLRTKVDEARIPVVVGDMATSRAPGEFTLVYLVYNTISNLHPPVDRHVVDLDAALGQQPLKVPVGQAVPEVPPDRESDHVRREPEPGERRSLNHRHRHPPSTHSPTLPQPTDKRGRLRRGCNRALPTASGIQQG